MRYSSIRSNNPVLLLHLYHSYSHYQDVTVQVSIFVNTYILYISINTTHWSSTNMSLTNRTFPIYNLFTSLLHSNTLDDTLYIKHIKHTVLQSQHILACSCSNNTILLYTLHLLNHNSKPYNNKQQSIDDNNNNQHTVQYYKTITVSTNTNESIINEIQFVDVINGIVDTRVFPNSDNPYLLCALDHGSVRVYDIRTCECISKYQMPVRTSVLTCSSLGGKLICGCDNNILYIYEMQSNILLAKLELHTDLITNILFSPTNSNIFYTAGDDGLIHQIIPGQQPIILDGMDDIDSSITNDIEDAWVGTVINVEQSIKRIGFFGPTHQFLYCISNTETLSLWFSESGERVSDEFTNVRKQLTEQSNCCIDYLIDCYFDSRSQRLFLAAGSNTGQLLLAHVNRNSIQSIGLCAPQSQYMTHNELLHTNTIRDIFWYNDIIISVGEDSRICGWTCDKTLLQQSQFQLDFTIKQLQSLQSHHGINHTTMDTNDTDTAPHIHHKSDGSCCTDSAIHMNLVDESKSTSDSDSENKQLGKRNNKDNSNNNNTNLKLRRTQISNDSD